MYVKDLKEKISAMRGLFLAAAGAAMLLSGNAWAGFDEGIAAHKSGDYELALKEFQAVASNGDARAQYMIAEMLRKGEGADVDMEAAAAWYRAAAELGHPAAQNALGTLYAMGAGVEQDDTQAYVWFSLSAMLGNTTAEKNLARAKDLISSGNKRFGDQIIQQYVPMYVLPYQPAPGFAKPGFPGAQ